MKYVIVLIFLVGIFIAVINLFGKFYPQRISTPPPSSSITSTPSQKPTVIPSITQDLKRNIYITYPKNGEQLNLPFTISGEARVFENQFNYRILDANGKKLIEGSAYANSLDSGLYGPFTIEIKSLPPIDSPMIFIEVFDYSPKDGSEIDKVIVSAEVRSKK